MCNFCISLISEIKQKIKFGDKIGVMRQKIKFDLEITVIRRRIKFDLKLSTKSESIQRIKNILNYVKHKVIV